ncbi:Uncharacterised protein [uncultured archaeon]|nr:Uncharacterised protein [uncultured archaeon]
MTISLNLPFMRKPKEGQPGGAASAPEQPESEEELRHRIYKFIIERYREVIEEQETRSVSDMKAAVKPHEPKIAEIKEALTGEFHPYVYEENFLAAAKMAYEYVSSFRTVSVPVSFWLSFTDMGELMAGDEIDKSILLCSLLRALGSENAKVFVTDSKNSYVLFQFSGKSYVVDHSQKEIAAKETGEDALQSIKGKILYSFNDKEYEDFQESE